MITITRTEALDQLDELRTGLYHDPMCETAGFRCPACDTSTRLSPIIRDLYDGYSVQEVRETARYASHSLPYTLAQRVIEITTQLVED